MNLISRAWAKEPAILTVLGSVAFWPLLFNFLGEFGHPLTTGQQQALSALGVFIATAIIRNQVTSPDTLQKMAPATLEKAQNTEEPVKDVVKKLPAVVIACVLGAGVMTLPSCALHQQPPAGTYSPAGTKTYNADQLIKDLDALGQTARNLNAVSGPEHLTDRDTVYIRDASLIAGAGLYAYGKGATTLDAAKAALDTLPTGYLPPAYLVPARAAFDKAIADHGAGASALYLVVDVYKTLRANVSVSATNNPRLTTILNAVDAGVAAIPLQ